MDKESTKRFDDWESVIDCNDCARYWDNSCDGVAVKAGNKRCMSFVATRNILIPNQIKELQKEVKWLGWSCMLLGIAFVIHIVGGLL